MSEGNGEETLRNESGKFLVGPAAILAFEGEMRKIRTMQAEALAGYHEV